MTLPLHVGGGHQLGVGGGHQLGEQEEELLPPQLRQSRAKGTVRVLLAIFRYL